jgi:hypothetical protein
VKRGRDLHQGLKESPIFFLAGGSPKLFHPLLEGEIAPAVKEPDGVAQGSPLGSRPLRGPNTAQGPVVSIMGIAQGSPPTGPSRSVAYSSRR